MRAFFRYYCLVLSVLFWSAQLVAEPESVTPQNSLSRLLEGNKRYVSGKLLHPERDSLRRLETVKQQEPFAIVLGCSDSRVSPEIIFDQGIGDIFVVRVAGNVAGPIEIDSIDYSALHLHSSIILVLGHKNCGAVKAVLEGNSGGIESVAALIAPAIEASKNTPGDCLENAVKMNVTEVVKQLHQSAVLAKLVQAGQIQIVGGYYDLKTGQVELLESTSSK